MRALLVSCVLLAACGPSRQTVGVQKQRGIDGAWRTENVILRTEGPVARVYLADRTFVIQRFESFRGIIDPEVVMLRGTNFEIRITNEKFEVGFKQAAPREWSLEAMAPGSVATFDGRELTFSAGKRP